MNSRTNMMIGWSVVAVVATALFWGTWYLIAGSVPVVTRISWPPAPWAPPFTLPFGISRWWDCLFVIPLAILLVAKNTAKPTKEIFVHSVVDTAVVFFVAATVFFGSFFSLGVGLVFGLASSLIVLCVGLVFAIVCGLVLGAITIVKATIKFTKKEELLKKWLLGQ